MTRQTTSLSALLTALIGCAAMVTLAAAQPLPPPPPLTAPNTNAAPAPPVKPKPKPKQKAKAPLTLEKSPARPPAAVGTNAPPPATQPPAAPPVVQSTAPLSKSAAALDPRQRAIVERVSNYLSNLRTLVGEFKQVAPDGTRTHGEFYLWRPGRVRFEYSDPSPIVLVADGRSVIVRDRNLATQDEYGISQTPLRFLLADRVDLLRDTNIVAVYGDNIFLTVVIEEKQIVSGSYRLMLMFDAQHVQLKQWVVTDPQGLDTTVAVYNLDTSTKPDPELFKIDRTRYVR